MTTKYDPTLCDRLCREAKSDDAEYRTGDGIRYTTSVMAARQRDREHLLVDQLEAAGVEIERLTADAKGQVARCRLESVDRSDTERALTAERDHAKACAAQLHSERAELQAELNSVRALVPPDLWSTIETWCSELETSEAVRVRGLLDAMLVDQRVVRLQAELEASRREVEDLRIRSIKEYRRQRGEAAALDGEPPTEANAEYQDAYRAARKAGASCPRARTSMTPCAIRDGEMAETEDGRCVGCDLYRDARCGDDEESDYEKLNRELHRLGRLAGKP